ncbi:hypothetical protein CCHR01_06125 [Colletotrichum chrysophilum]|uniref:Uncharacterized protein n=1 Tax=Colletotrichum chrysophilum TaxID=1836956 RepID=A0AAD9APP0_9PEZI|nr:hypothetical protein CCHR01_06125 [Colletotrichum chrysophilum]
MPRQDRSGQPAGEPPPDYQDAVHAPSTPYGLFCSARRETAAIMAAEPIDTAATAVQPNRVLECVALCLKRDDRFSCEINCRVNRSAFQMHLAASKTTTGGQSPDPKLSPAGSRHTEIKGA